MSIDTILIFNRGEIACRVIRTARALGYRTVGVYAKDEGRPLAAELADEAVLIGADRRAYLSSEIAIETARRTGADALHPGYGFLSENPGLARACLAAGVTFIGPPAEAMEAMGDKAAARRLMAAAGVACVPGYDGEAQDDARLRQEAARIGYPLMVKAAAGGGGKGLRIVEEAAGFDGALRAARSEARAAFGSDLLILERALRRVRHVEVQIFADSHGNVVHLGERDCSVQRRHQKIIEETPSPAVSPELREALGASAVRAAAAVGYRGAGTVEYLLDAEGSFYFLEMNTRLQVEHPITEAVTGIDLVAWQIDVAAGGKLPLAQADITMTGAAIEARLYAESADLDFLPRSGMIAALDWPQAEGLRIDHGLSVGGVVSPGYDPLLAKIIAHGSDREAARRRLAAALRRVFVGGTETNRGFLLAVLRHPAFCASEVSTDFIADHGEALRPRAITSSDLALANLLVHQEGAGASAITPRRARTKLNAEGHETLILAAPEQHGGWHMRFEDGSSHLVAIERREAHYLRYSLDGVQRSAWYCFTKGRLQLSLPDRDVSVMLAPLTPIESEAVASQDVLSPITGAVVAVYVGTGDGVSEGTKLVVVEAMKMEHEISARQAGRIGQVLVTVGQSVEAGERLLAFDDDAAGLLDK